MQKEKEARLFGDTQIEVHEKYMGFGNLMNSNYPVKPKEETDDAQ